MTYTRDSSQLPNDLTATLSNWKESAWKIVIVKFVKVVGDFKGFLEIIINTPRNTAFRGFGNARAFWTISTNFIWSLRPREKSSWAVTLAFTLYVEICGIELPNASICFGLLLDCRIIFAAMYLAQQSEVMFRSFVRSNTSPVKSMFDTRKMSRLALLESVLGASSNNIFENVSSARTADTFGFCAFLSKPWINSFTSGGTMSASTSPAWIFFDGVSDKFFRASTAKVFRSKEPGLRSRILSAVPW